MSSKVSQRRRELESIMQNESRIFVNEMSKLFRVTKETIRNDFDFLADTYGYERFHGGIKKNDIQIMDSEYLFTEKKSVNEEDKKQICFRAVDLLNDGDCIYIDGGSTVSYLLNYIGRKKNLTIITPSIAILTKYSIEKLEISFRENHHELIFIGGHIHSNIQTTYGSFFDRMVEHIYFDQMFLSFDGIDLEKHCTNGDQIAFHIADRIRKQSNRKIVLAECSKFGVVKRYKSMDLKDVDVLVTNISLDEQWKKSLKDYGVLYYKA
jgi:DeoR/GlpR family transcriptional regulator of sugar metabolism